MNASAPIAPGSPQRPPTRAAPSLVRALRDALGVPSMDAVDDPLPLDRHQPFYPGSVITSAILFGHWGSEWRVHRTSNG